MTPPDALGDFVTALRVLTQVLQSGLEGLREELIRLGETARDVAPSRRRDQLDRRPRRLE